MAAFSALTADQQSQLLGFMPVLRAGIAELAKVCNHGARLDQTWTAGIKAIVASLDAGTVIPDTTGLAGAASLTSDDLNAMMTAIEQGLAVLDTAAQQAAYLKAVGAANVNG